MTPMNFFHEIDENPSSDTCFCEQACECGVVASKDTVPFYASTSDDLCLFCGEAVNGYGRCTRATCHANHY